MVGLPVWVFNASPVIQPKYTQKHKYAASSSTQEGKDVLLLRIQLRVNERFWKQVHVTQESQVGGSTERLDGDTYVGLSLTSYIKT